MTDQVFSAIESIMNSISRTRVRDIEQDSFILSYSYRDQAMDFRTTLYMNAFELTEFDPDFAQALERFSKCFGPSIKS